ncbi:hypothetical protein RhiirC2_743611 [Rhizophagus irregularis]|uniref:Uncharacterized protein n=1 Tax=Rhizophagus irregularis TaxID=588596 RepID=A0A2N1NDN2_9GLOM|nr:hypothetical protein RhiirC2_743611 [Rhizophagus irregularis]
MSDKAEVPDKSKTSDKLEKFLVGRDIILNYFIPDDLALYKVGFVADSVIINTLRNNNVFIPQRIYSSEKRINVIMYPPTETVPHK